MPAIPWTPTLVSFALTNAVETYIGSQMSGGEMLAMANFNINSDYGCEIFQSCQ